MRIRDFLNIVGHAVKSFQLGEDTEVLVGVRLADGTIQCASPETIKIGKDEYGTVGITLMVPNGGLADMLRRGAASTN